MIVIFVHSRERPWIRKSTVERLKSLEEILKFSCHYSFLYNNSSYSRILIGSRLWSIRGQMQDWSHHYKVFPSAVLKWRKVLSIKTIFYAIRQRILAEALNMFEKQEEERYRAVSVTKWSKTSRAVLMISTNTSINWVSLIWPATSIA